MSEATPEREPTTESGSDDVQSREDWEREREEAGDLAAEQAAATDEPTGPPPEQDDGDQDDGDNPEPDNPDGAEDGK